MKIQIDTDAKTIKIEGQVSVKEFYDKVQKLLPEDWESYKLETNTIIQNWGNPIIVRPYATRPWWEWSQIYCNASNRTDNLLSKMNHTTSSPTYNIEC